VIVLGRIKLGATAFGPSQVCKGFDSQAL
jgi:hypothetical protein